MSEKLRNCPFCGENPSIKNVTLPFDVGKGRKITQCKCGAFLYAGRWNTRPIEDDLQHRIAELTTENSALREQVKNLQMSETHKIRVQAVKHMLEQTAFLRKCFALDVFRNYPRLRDEGLKILDGELYNEEEK